MVSENFEVLFSSDNLEKIFPESRTDEFFEALLGDAEDGAYDIRFKFKAHENNSLRFEFHLVQRPGKCLMCSLTYGLPEVFVRHPIINLQGLYEKLQDILGDQAQASGWEIGRTRQAAKDMHVIPFTVTLN